MRHLEAVLGHLRDLLFCINIGLLTIVERANATRFGSLIQVQYAVNDFFHLQPHSSVGGYGAVLIFTAGLAAVIFVLLQVLVRLAPSDAALEWITGIGALAAAPVIWLYLVLRFGYGDFDVAFGWPAVELVVTLTCLVLYLTRKWPIPRSASILLITLHWALWSWIYNRHFMTPGLFFALVGFCSSLAWAAHLVQQDGRPVVTSAGPEAHPI
jgi:hypothetical protein